MLSPGLFPPTDGEVLGDGVTPVPFDDIVPPGSLGEGLLLLPVRAPLGEDWFDPVWVGVAPSPVAPELGTGAAVPGGGGGEVGV